MANERHQGAAFHCGLLFQLQIRVRTGVPAVALDARLGRSLLCTYLLGTYTYGTSIQNTSRCAIRALFVGLFHPTTVLYYLYLYLSTVHRGAPLASARHLPRYMFRHAQTQPLINQHISPRHGDQFPPCRTTPTPTPGIPIHHSLAGSRELTQPTLSPTPNSTNWAVR